MARFMATSDQENLSRFAPLAVTKKNVPCDNFFFVVFFRDCLRREREAVVGTLYPGVCITRVRGRTQEEPRRTEAHHRSGAGHRTPGGSGRIRVAARWVQGTRGEEGAGVGRLAHMGPGRLRHGIELRHTHA